MRGNEPRSCPTLSYSVGSITLGTMPAALKKDLENTMMKRSERGSMKRVFGAHLALASTLVLMLSPMVRGQKYVFNALSMPTGQNPADVGTGDFNGDGIADLVVTNQGESTVSVYLGKADGTFQTKIDVTVGANPRYVAAGDLNGDGLADLVLTGGAPNATVSVLLSNRDGTFTPTGSFPTGNGPSRAAIGDVNDDGKADLVIANATNATVSVLLGNGDGTFQGKTDYTCAANQSAAPQAVALADLNGDGHADIVAANTGWDTLGVLLGNGDGTFQAVKEIQVTSAPVTVVAGDFNGDGKTDLAVPNNQGDTIPGASNAISILLGRGDGTFGIATDYKTPGPTQALQVADFDGDGSLDLAAFSFSSTAAGTVTVLLGKGDGSFQVHGNYGGVASFASAVGDFNGDSHMDVAMLSRDDFLVNVLLGDGSGGLSSIADSPILNRNALSTPDLFAGEFTGDGKLDLVSTYLGLGGVALSKGNGDGTFQAPQGVSMPGFGPIQAVGDINGDGKLDIAILYSGSTSGLGTLFGNGDGTFTAGPLTPIGTLPSRMVAADLNGDGKLDLAACGLYTVALLGTGDGNFQVTAGSSLQQAPATCIVTDLNNDGKPDLVAAYQAGGVSVYLGKGDGTFQDRVDYPIYESPAALDAVAADFNNDGNMDIAVVNNVANVVLIAFGNGDGTLQPQTAVSTPEMQASGTRLKAGDFTGRGKVDLAVQGNLLEILPGNGDGTFEAGVVYGNERSTILLAEDVVGDGKKELITDSLGPSVYFVTPSIAIRPTQLTFGNQAAGTTGEAQKVTVYNPGVTAIGGLSGNTATPFTESTTCGPSLSAGDSCLFSLAFAPTASGQQSGALKIQNNAPSKTQSVPLQATGTDFAIAAISGATPSTSVIAGQTATFQLEVNALSGFTGTVSLACSGIAASAGSCSMTPNSVDVNGVTVPFTLSVQTNTGAAAGMILKPPIEWRPTPLYALGIAVLLAIYCETKRRQQPALVMAAVLCLAFTETLLGGCGGGSGTGSKPKPPTTYTITVTGTANGVTRTLPLTVTVTQP
jgi:hypothetical protein